jgi:acetyl esterase/lipase
MKIRKLFVLSLCLLTLASCGNPAVSSAAASTTVTTSETVNYNLAEGLKYGSASEHEIGDIYTPKDASQPTMGVVFMHGGAFRGGDEKMSARVAKWLANHGVAVFCIRYRLVDEKKFPGAVSDVKAAVRYLRKNAASYNINPDQIVTWGESAGAYLSVMGAITGGTTALDGDVTDNLDVSSKADACVDFYGPICIKKYKDTGLCGFLGIQAADVDLPANAELVASSDPATYLDSWTKTTACRYIIQHGSADTMVTNNESHYLYDTLSPVYGTDKVTLEIKEGLNHMDAGFYTDENMSGVVTALSDYLKQA